VAVTAAAVAVAVAAPAATATAAGGPGRARAAAAPAPAAAPTTAPTSSATAKAAPTKSTTAKAAATPAAAGATPPGTASPTWLENQNQGSTAWQIPQPGMRVGDDAGLQLEAYADHNGVEHGQTIGFHVTTTPAQNYGIQIFRMGYYGGTGARLMATSPQIGGKPQPICPLDVPTGLIECAWSTGWQLTVPSDWLSGLYLAVFTNASGYQWADPFTVTDPARASAILMVDPVNTYEAYNEWPYDQVYGKDLYDGFGPVTNTGTERAGEVSFDRPYQQEHGAGERDRGPNWAARWLEQNGYDVTYATSTDVQNGTVDLSKYKVYFSPGHDEYWSKQMYDAVQNAETAGMNLTFTSANSIYWQVRSAPSPTTGAADRVMICWKGTGDPVTGPTTTDLWRTVGRPEQALLGASYSWAMGPDTNWVSTGTNGPALAGAQLPAGAVVRNLVGVEADSVMPGQPNPDASQFYVISNDMFRARGVTTGAPNYAQESTLYQSATSHAWVFDAGTFNWGKGLSDNSDGYADGRVATAMANILGLMLGGQNAVTIDRVAGSTRYGTAAAISKYAFPNGAQSVYIANGTAFADALTGAPAAGHDQAPTLLTTTTALPAETIGELVRIAPRTIYVLGGPGVVSPAVVQQLAQYAHGGGVQRLAGADRFGTAVAVSQHAFAPGVPAVYVAAGTGYPDAMAAGAEGAHQGAPVLLTGGTALNPATAAEIQRLHPAKIVVLGGTQAVSPDVQNQLAAFAPVFRASGPDRVQTAVALASMTQYPGGTDTVYLANGITLADGLTGGAAAGLAGASMLTTDSANLNPWAASEIRLLNPRHIVVLGGTGVINPGAVSVIQQLFSGSTLRSFAAAVGAPTEPGGSVGTTPGGSPTSAPSGPSGPSGSQSPSGPERTPAAPTSPGEPGTPTPSSQPSTVGGTSRETTGE
jgi:putative cell wall-binding protein